MDSVRCKVLPPQNFIHPVLPIKINGKLMFPLCFKCAENTQQSTNCIHTAEERMLRSTWVSLELEKAVEKGYRIIEIESVWNLWNFREKCQLDPSTESEGLFTPYIDTFLNIKQEASGWPDWCQTDEDKTRYVTEYIIATKVYC